MKISVDGFKAQWTHSFPTGEPIIEEYGSRYHYEIALRKYRAEWRGKYRCRGCDSLWCPQCREE